MRDLRPVGLVVVCLALLWRDGGPPASTNLSAISSVPNSVPTDFPASDPLTAALHATRAAPIPQPGGAWAVADPRRDVRAVIDADGSTSLRRADGRALRLDLAAPGLTLEPPAVALGACVVPEPDLSGACPREVRVDHGPIEAWWRGGDHLEQGWTVHTPPPGDTLRLELGVPATGDATAVQAGAFVARGLAAWDADHRPLAAAFEPGAALAIRVDVRGAAWPVTVDPTWEGTLWWTEPFPGLRQTDLAAAALGDLNGDGWPDLAITVTDHDADLTTLFIVHGVEGGYADTASQIVPLPFAPYTSRLTPLDDVDGDGFADLLIDADRLDAGPLLLSGGPAAPHRIATVLPGWITFDPPAAGDLNGDGHTDLAWPGIVGAVSGVWVSEGGPAGLGAPTLWDPRGPPIAIADLSGDGRDDLVLGLAAPEVLAEGASGPRLLLDAAPHPVQRVATAPSVDGDGAAEVILYDRRLASVRLSAGGGASSAPALVSSERLSPVGGDLTGDGLPDLVNDRVTYAVSVLADGNYVETSLLSGGDGAVWRQPGDLDGDGQPELLVVADGQLVLLRGAAPFVAEATPEVAWSWSTSGNTLAPVGDVNADGFDDLAAFTFRAGADPGAGRLDLLPGGPAGPATVASFTLLGVTGADVRPSGRYGDLTGDGVDDLLVGFGGLDPSATIALHPGSPAGPAPTPTWTVSGTTPDLPGRAVVAPGDVDGDGLNDLVYTVSDLAYGTPGAVVLAHGRPGGLEPTPTTTLAVTLPATLSPPGDVNGDGLADVLLVGGAYGLGPAGAEIEVLLGDPRGWGRTLPLPPTPPASRFNAAPAGDLDGDGRAELVVTTAGGDRLDTAAAGSGALVRAPGAVVVDRALKLGQSPNLHSTADVNGDGHRDLLAGFDGVWRDGEGAALFLGRPGGWSSAVAWVSPLDTFAVRDAGDLNGDGFSDLLLTASGTATLWFGSPRGPLPASCAGQPDLDGDGVCAGLDPDDADPTTCADVDADGCDDCLANDGPDLDGDGQCDAGDPDRDGDGAPDALDLSPVDDAQCGDTDADGCDDCAAGRRDPADDGPDLDGDGACDLTDPDDDGDLAPDTLDAAPLDASACGVDLDGDGCEDCASGRVDVLTDGADLDGDGLCDAGDPAPAVCPVGVAPLFLAPPGVVGWGTDLALVGDHDGDGVADLAVVSDGRLSTSDEGSDPAVPSEAWTVSSATGALIARLGDGGDPRALAVGAGDADGDGWPDLILTTSPRVVSGRYDLESRPGGATFQPGGPTPGPQRALMAAAAWTDGPLSAAWLGDVNRDQLDDVAILEAVASDGQPGWSLSLWTGSDGGPYLADRVFTPSAALTANLDSPWDADGDGLRDLVIADETPWLVRFDAAGLHPPVPWGPPLGITPRRAAHADVNGDGAVDLVTSTACDGDPVAWVVRYGGPSGLGGGPPDTTLITAPCSDWVLADADGDAHVDLLIAHSGGGDGREAEGTITVVPGSPSGPDLLAARTWVSGVQQATSGRALAVLPGASARLVFTGALPGSHAGGMIGAWPLAAPGLAALPAPWRSASYTLGRWFAVDDFDQDGRDDVVFDHDGVDADLHLGQPGGLDPAATWFLGAIGSAQPAGDVDGDGSPDVLVEWSSWAGVLLGGPGGLLRDRAVSIPTRGLTPVGDTDGDGLAELAEVAGLPADRDGWSVVLHQPSPRTLTLPRITTHWVYGGAVRQGGDLDGDGFDDLVVLEADAQFGVDLPRGAAGWMRGGPGGPTGLTPFADVFGALRDLTVRPVGDVDGDGFADLVIGEPGWVETFDLGGQSFAGAPRGRIRLFRGGPSGPTASTEVRGDAGAGRFGAQVLATGDVDQDGHADVLTSFDGPAWGGAGGVLLRGSPTGLVATPAWVGPCELSGAALAAGDFDGDGVAELIASTGSDAAGGRVYTSPFLFGPPVDTDPPLDTDPPTDTDAPPDTAAPAVPTPRVPVADPACGCAHGRSSAGAIALLAVALRRRSQASPAR